jgi:GNAT superfamily N-acetyltransferase
VNAADRRAAVALLLTGRPEPDDGAVQPFLDFAAEHEMDLRHFWVGRDGRRPDAAVLLVPGVGKTAMLFCSPVADSGSVAGVGRLVRHAVAGLDPAEIGLVQSLLDQGQDLQRRAVEAGGLRFLAELTYMHRPGRATQPPPRLMLDDRPLRAVTWTEARRPLFAQAIADSYTDTLDCPGLRGLREMDDIIDGHMASGKFDPQDWRVWVDPGDRPAAVLLLAESAQGRGVELVYLGICPHARRRGLAKRIMQIALDRAARPNPVPLHLAVDARNHPARRLYAGLDFRHAGHKTALIATPGRPADAEAVEQE